MQIEDPHGWREACPKGKEPEEAEEKKAKSYTISQESR